MNRMRSSAILIFCAYIALVLDGMGFQKSTEEVVKSSLPTDHPALAATYVAIQVAAMLGLLATVAGGLPLAWVALRQAVAMRRWGIAGLFAVPPLALAAWLFYTWLLLNVIFPARVGLTVQQTMGFWLSVSWVAVLILAAIASVAAVSLAIARSEIPARLYRYALGPEVALVVAMALTAVGVAAWTLQLWAVAPSALAAPDGPAGLRESLGLHLVTDIVVMLLATLLALTGWIRAGSARRRLETTPALTSDPGQSFG